ncbi:hypothetical protein [Onishia taeanensis]
MMGPQRSLPAIGLNPELQLQQLWAHEQAEKMRYRRLAFTFLPIDLATSRLLALLGMECESRLATLEQRACPRRLSESLPAPEKRGQPSGARDDAPLATARRHFTQAIAAAKHAQHFYEAMCEANGTLTLQPLLEEGFRQKRAEHILLLEHLESLRLPTSPSSTTPD